MRNALVGSLVVIALCAFNTPVAAQELQAQGSVQLSGDIAKKKQLSGIALFRGLLIVCPDEGTSFNVLKPSGTSGYAVVSTTDLLDDGDADTSDEDAECDLEGATSDDEHVYLIGSHALARVKVKKNNSYEENRENFKKIKEHVGADSLFRLELDEDGAVTAKQRISLRELLKSDEFLKPFNKLPSKENGIDIEGVAAKDGKLFVGFRAPVLRENYVPVMVLEFEDPQSYELRFVDLRGHGIRDMAAVEGGFLLIGGPMGDSAGTYTLYFWNGEDCIPGAGAPGGSAQPVAALPSDTNAKYEGIAVTGESDTAWDIMVIREGETTAPRFRVRKP